MLNSNMLIQKMSASNWKERSREKLAYQTTVWTVQSCENTEVLLLKCSCEEYYIMRFLYIRVAKKRRLSLLEILEK